MKPNDERKIIIILSVLKHRVVKFTVSMLWAEKSEIHVDLLHSAFVNFIIIRCPGGKYFKYKNLQYKFSRTYGMSKGQKQTEF